MKAIKLCLLFLGFLISNLPLYSQRFPLPVLPLGIPVPVDSKGDIPTDSAYISDMKIDALNNLVENKFDNYWMEVLVECYKRAKQEDSISIYIDNLVLLNIDEPEAYLIKANYSDYYLKNSDSIKLYCYQKAFCLDSNNTKANTFLGNYYYSHFINANIKKMGKEIITQYANKSYSFLLRAWHVDLFCRAPIKYHLIQLSSYLGLDYKEYDKFIEPQDESRGVKNCYASILFRGDSNKWKNDFTTDVRTLLDTSLANGFRCGKFLSALNEPVIYNDTAKYTVYRFLWLRCFREPVAIRIENRNNEITLYWKESNGKGGYEPGELILDKQISLKKNVWDDFVKLINANNYWQMDANSYTIPMDGSWWYLEGKTGDNYRIVFRCCGGEKSFNEICTYLLKLTKMKIDKRDLY